MATATTARVRGPRALKAIEPKDVQPSRPKILIFGPAGVGKTWGALDFPSVYYADVEGGADGKRYVDKLRASNGMYFGPEEGAQDFDALIEEVITLSTVEHPYKTLVIDSFSKLFNTQVATTEERMKKAGEKPAFGNEKKEAVAQTRRLIRYLDRLDMNVILICHEKTLYQNGETAGMTFDGWDKLRYELQLCLRITKQGPLRIATVDKSRYESFPDASNFPWSYKEFADRFGKEVIESQSHTIAFATAEQIAKIKELLEIVRASPEDAEKLLKKAKAEAWEEVPTEQIQTWIDSLKERIAKLATAGQN